MITSEIIIDNIVTLSKIIVCVNNEFGGQIWWRGNPRYEYKLQPAIFRQREASGGTNYEQSINIRFLQKAPALRAQLPSKDSFWEWLFLMQHYRHPTRLLDWTESPLIACYFACTSFDKHNLTELKSDGALFGFSPHRLNYYQIRQYGTVDPRGSDNLPIVRGAFEKGFISDQKCLGVTPTFIDPRMISQLSVFTIHSDNEPLEDNTNSTEFLVKFRIPSNSKEALREQLKHAGIRPSNLFPDLEHLSSEIQDVKSFKPTDYQPPAINANNLRHDTSNK